MARLILISVVLLGLVTGCGPRYGGGLSSSYGNADGTSTEIVIQRDPNGQLLFVIAWTSMHFDKGSVSFSARNLLTNINGVEVHPNLNRRAVYALQTDGSLRSLALSDEQVTALFREMMQAGFHTSHSELWQKIVAPNLTDVPAPNKGS